MIASSLKVVAATAGLALSLLSTSDTPLPSHAAVDTDAQSFTDNPEYRGDFVFTRIRYDSPGGWGYRRGRSSWWSHDYPRADQHLSTLLDELTNIRVELEGTNVFVLDDPELFKYPLAHISEPGFWTMTDEEAQSLREYVLRGGFLIFDDFEREQWYNMEAQLQRVLPEYHLIEIDVSHPIFHTFFEMKTIDFPHPLVPVMPSYFGLFEDNVPPNECPGLAPARDITVALNAARPTPVVSRPRHLVAQRWAQRTNHPGSHDP